MCIGCSVSDSSIQSENKMSIVGTIKNLLMIIGVRVLSKQDLPPFLARSRMAINNLHVICLILILATFNISTACFLIFEATSFTQYSGGVMIYMINCLHSSFYVTSVWKRQTILGFVADLERIVQISKI